MPSQHYHLESHMVMTISLGISPICSHNLRYIVYYKGIYIKILIFYIVKIRISSSHISKWEMDSGAVITLLNSVFSKGVSTHKLSVPKLIFVLDLILCFLFYYLVFHNTDTPYSMCKTGVYP